MEKLELAPRSDSWCWTQRPPQSSGQPSPRDTSTGADGPSRTALHSLIQKHDLNTIQALLCGRGRLGGRQARNQMRRLLQGLGSPETRARAVAGSNAAVCSALEDTERQRFWN